jgi:RimJ/RimL family protein N-acetyltransferase
MRNAYFGGSAETPQHQALSGDGVTKGPIMLTTEPNTEPMITASNFVLERRVNRPTRAVAKRLRDQATIAPTNGFALGTDGTLVVEGTPRPSSNPIVAGHESWRTTARLLTARGRRVARLDIEISTWTPGSVLLQLRPTDRNPRRWSARRTRRYFELAHASADRLERILNESTFGAVTIRPIEARDVDGLRDLFWRLSPESRYYRFLSPVQHPRESTLHHLAEVDHGHRDALVASVDDRVVAVARYDRSTTEPRAAEVAVVVEDAWHRQGIATALLRELGGVASERGVERFTATVAADNRAITRLVRSLPVRATWNWDQGERRLDVPLHHAGMTS